MGKNLPLPKEDKVVRGDTAPNLDLLRACLGKIDLTEEKLSIKILVCRTTLKSNSSFWAAFAMEITRETEDKSLGVFFMANESEIKELSVEADTSRAIGKVVRMTTWKEMSALGGSTYKGFLQDILPWLSTILGGCLYVNIFESMDTLERHSTIRVGKTYLIAMEIKVSTQEDTSKLKIFMSNLRRYLEINPMDTKMMSLAKEMGSIQSTSIVADYVFNQRKGDTEIFKDMEFVQSVITFNKALNAGKNFLKDELSKLNPSVEKHLTAAEYSFIRSMWTKQHPSIHQLHWCHGILFKLERLNLFGVIDIFFSPEAQWEMTNYVLEKEKEKKNAKIEQGKNEPDEGTGSSD